MNFKVNFKESNQKFKVDFGNVIQIGEPIIISKEITENGTYRANDDEASGYNPVVVNVDTETPYNEGYAEGYTNGVASVPIYYASTLGGLFTGAIFPANYNFVLRVKKSMALNGTIRQSQNIKTVKLICDEISGTVNLSDFARYCASVETIDLTEYNRKISNLSSAFASCSKLKSILGALDLSSCTNVSGFVYCGSLEKVEFVPNTIKPSISFSSCGNLTTETIESIIDGLVDLTGQTAQTVSWHSKVLEKLTLDQCLRISNKNWLYQ